MMTVKHSGDWISTEVDDEIVMMSQTSGDYVGLTPTGALIWKALENTDDVVEICSKLRKQFDVSEVECKQEVEAFLQKLSSRGAITGYQPAKS